MAYSYTLYRSIQEIAPDEWNLLRRDDRDPLMDPRYILAVELSMADSSKFWHVLFRDERQQPVACACLCSFAIDATLLAEGWLKRVAAFFSRIAPRLVTFKMLFCGLPVSSGDSHLRFAPNADTAEILKLLDEVLLRIAAQERVKCIIFKEFEPNECTQLASLMDLGYLRADSLPMNHANSKFRDFEDYCSQLPSRKRYPIRRSQKKFAQSELRVVQMKGGDGVERIYTDEVHRLYENVVEKAAIKLERLPAAYFREVARHLPEASAFTFVYQGERVVAFAVSVFTKTVFHQLFVGVDHRLNPECDLYFNLFFHAIDYGLKLQVLEMPVGQTADTFKEQKLGCEHRPLYIYIKGARWDSSLVLRSAFGMLFPPRFPPPSPNGAAVDA